MDDFRATYSLYELKRTRGFQGGETLKTIWSSILKTQFIDIYVNVSQILLNPVSSDALVGFYVAFDPDGLQ